MLVDGNLCLRQRKTKRTLAFTCRVDDSGAYPGGSSISKLLRGRMRREIVIVYSTVSEAVGIVR
jgi:hypothetical protein